jgi:hypothetical protein
MYIKSLSIKQRKFVFVCAIFLNIFIISDIARSLSFVVDDCNPKQSNSNTNHEITDNLLKKNIDDTNIRKKKCVKYKRKEGKFSGQQLINKSIKLKLDKEQKEKNNLLDETERKTWKLAHKDSLSFIEKIKKTICDSDYLLYSYRHLDDFKEIKIGDSQAKDFVSQYFDITGDIICCKEQGFPILGLYVLSMLGYQEAISQKKIYFLNTTLWIIPDNDNTILDRRIYFFDEKESTSYVFTLNDKFCEFIKYYFSTVVQKHGGFYNEKLKAIGNNNILRRPSWLEDTVLPIKCPCPTCTGVTNEQNMEDEAPKPD